MLLSKLTGQLRDRWNRNFIPLEHGIQQNLGLKVMSTTFLLVCFLSLNESTCQTKKNAFYFTSEALFILEKIKF